MQEIKLRDNTTIKDRRLDVILDFDQKSLDHPVTVPSIVPINRVWLPGPVLDQGSEGACVGFALVGCLMTEAHKTDLIPFVSETIFSCGDKFAREKVYWSAQRLDGLPGGEYPGAKPRYQGTTLQDGIKVLQNMGIVKSYTWGFSLQDLILGVGYNGPAVLVMPWYESMYEADSKDFSIKPKGQIVGSHCILVRGVNVSKRYFLLRNSWGKSFGLSGDCMVGFTDMELIFREFHQIAFLNTK